MRERWGSRIGFVLATAGFAVGLGNIWRFPYLVGQYGGGAFLLVYLAFAVLIGIPLVTAEISLGRKSQRSPIAGMERLTGSRTNPWNLIGWLGVATALVITAYYVMLLAWIVAYFVMIADGQFQGSTPDAARASYETFIARPGPVIAYAVGIVLVMTFIVRHGVHQGVELMAKLVMPTFVLLLVVLAIRALTFRGAGAGLAWYLTPDFSVLNGQAVLAALGQAFYSIGIGMAVAFGFGSYLDPEQSNVPGSAALVVMFDTGVAVLMGFVIFPTLFAFGMTPDSGPGLLFITMPALFEQMPNGVLFGGLFFLLLIMVGLTSQIALFEVLTTTLRDSLRLSRTRAASWVGVTSVALAIPVILSQGPWSHVRVFGLDLFGLADLVSGSYMLTAGAFMLALYVSFVWGWTRFRDETNAGSGRIKVFQSWKPFVRFLIPAAVAIVLLGGLGIL